MAGRGGTLAERPRCLVKPSLSLEARWGPGAPEAGVRVMGGNPRLRRGPHPCLREPSFPQMLTSKPSLGSALALGSRHLVLASWE